MRLIDADALMETIRAHHYPLRSHLNSTDNGMFTTGIQQAVDEQPTIDAVPVVRCKDCVHYYEREPVCLKIYSDGNVSADAWQERKPDDFCSYGERKDGDPDAGENQKLAH